LGHLRGSGCASGAHVHPGTLTLRFSPDPHSYPKLSGRVAGLGLGWDGM